MDGFLLEAFLGFEEGFFEEAFFDTFFAFFDTFFDTFFGLLCACSGSLLDPLGGKEPTVKKPLS